MDAAVCMAAGWHWHTEYDIRVGHPLGPAQRHTDQFDSGVVYTRNYSNCDVSVQCRSEIQLPTNAAQAGWDCKLVNCSCQDFADLYGTHPGLGFGCAPSAAQAWWKQRHCSASAGTETCCGGPACKVPGHAPCICPKGPGPWPPAHACHGTIRMKST